MARKSNITAMAVKMQAVRNVFQAPSSTTDVYPFSNLRFDIAGQTVENNEYTGSIHKSGPDVAGKTVSGSFNVNLRPPGGPDVPVADAWIPGRYLKSAKFTEVRQAVAIPAAPEALGVGSTTTAAKLGATAGTTLDLYKGMALFLSDKGTTYKERLTAIRSYATDKMATLMQTLPAIPGANWQLPKQLSYQRSISEAAAPFLSVSLWLDGVRIDLVDFQVSGLRIPIPVSSRESTQVPQMEVSFTASIETTADQATPSIPALGGTPLFKDGDYWAAYKAVGGSDLSLDFGLRTSYPPNPNFKDGSDAGELVESRSTLTMDRQAYLKAELDTLALAEAQAQHPLFAQWGYTPGKIVQVVVPDARFNYQSPELGGEFITERGEMYIDVFDKNVCINFPY